MNFTEPNGAVQAALVMLITVPVVYLSIKNNDQTLLSNLALLCFGYFFGKGTQPPLPPKP